MVITNSGILNNLYSFDENFHNHKVSWEQSKRTENVNKECELKLDASKSFEILGIIYERNVQLNFAKVWSNHKLNAIILETILVT